VVAGIFGIFSGFWWSYAALVLGLDHKWYSIPAADANKVVGVFLLCCLGSRGRRNTGLCV